MTIGRVKGSNAAGHLGWISVRCRICARVEDVTRSPYYVCPSCANRYEAYFCMPCARVLHYRCPYCKRELVSLVEHLQPKRERA